MHLSSHCELSGTGRREDEGWYEHLADSLVDASVRRERGHLGARQLCHPHLSLLGRLLRSHERDLLLRNYGLRLDFPDELFGLPSVAVPAKGP
jgi:hypothetical protein